MTPIFDSLSHPTLTGKWFQSKHDARFESLFASCEKNHIIQTFAVGMHTVEAYNHEDFIARCKTNPVLVPIAGMNPHCEDIKAEVKYIKSLGYRGVKLHPRFGNFDLASDKEKLVHVLDACYEEGLIVLLCTYLATSTERFPTTDPYWSLVEILKSAKKAKVVLLHGGITRVLLYADLVRFNKNLILDLSYTLIKYLGSSVEQDIKYLFQTFDQKICIGSDHPEFSQEELRAVAESLSEGISQEKKENIFHRNLSRFIS